jgi:hypothetical protein
MGSALRRLAADLHLSRVGSQDLNALKGCTMAEVLLKFAIPILDDDGHAYTPQICGRQAEDGLWDGWIEFVPADGRSALRTGRETRQPNRADLEYWAAGVTAAYLEGALERALHPKPETARVRPSAPSSARYEGPAAPAAAKTPVAPPPHPHAVLDPFSVWEQGEQALRQQLGALGVDHLRTIVREHALIGEHEVDLQEMHHATLVDLIVGAVHKRAG